jgi:hypothetical protein
MGESPTRSWWWWLKPSAMFHRQRLRYERIELAKQQQGECDELHDPIEDDPLIQPVLAEADALAETEVPHIDNEGWCHSFWAAKQRILRKQFDVEWFSPADMNPGTFFD